LSEVFGGFIGVRVGFLGVYRCLSEVFGRFIGVRVLQREFRSFAFDFRVIRDE